MSHPVQVRQPHQEYFRTIMHTVLGQALGGAGYELLNEPMKWLGGRYRYAKSLPQDNFTAYIEFQVLVYTEAGKGARFNVTLYRSDQQGGKISKHPFYASRTLSQLVVNDFGVAILPSADHWWAFENTETLGNALAEAGHLIIGYGLQWLSGDLTP